MALYKGSATKHEISDQTAGQTHENWAQKKIFEKGVNVCHKVSKKGVKMSCLDIAVFKEIEDPREKV